MTPHSTTRKPPLKPWIVLLVAALLPGMGQVLNNQATRAIVFLFFMISLAIVSYHLTTPAQSFLGRHAGGLFVYVIALVDAYRLATLRWMFYQKSSSSQRTKLSNGRAERD